LEALKWVGKLIVGFVESDLLRLNIAQIVIFIVVLVVESAVVIFPKRPDMP